VKLFYSPNYTLAAYDFETTRKARWIADSLTEAPIAGIELVAPDPATEEQISVLHDPAYVAAVRTGTPRALAESQGFRWDPALWPMVLASTGGVLAAARAARVTGVAGSLSSGLHHARHDHGRGYCTFNGLALAALMALSEGAQAVLILDLDAHCGGGTHALVANTPAIQHADIAVIAYDTYVPTAPNTLDLVHEASEYLRVIRMRLAELARTSTHFDLCLYNAGMDPHEGCREGGLAGITVDTLAEREHLIFTWCQEQRIPLAFVAAGGYTGPDLHQDELVALHRLSLVAAAAAS